MHRILIIDDDHKYRKYLRKVLELENYEVIDAPNGKVGAETFKQNPTDLIITDIFMPEQEGIETIIELVQFYPDVKIIAMSGGGDKQNFEHLQSAKDFGAVETFLKPIDRNVLINCIQKILS